MSHCKHARVLQTASVGVQQRLLPLDSLRAGALPFDGLESPCHLSFGEQGQPADLDLFQTWYDYTSIWYTDAMML